MNLETLTYYAYNTDLSNLMDNDSWIKWTIINEVMRNRDAILYGSAFFYQGPNKKVFMGPVWDFDLSAGGYVDNYPTGWYVTTLKIVGWAFTYNKPYRARFKAVWNAYKKQIASLPLYLESERTIIDLSQQRNYARWQVMSSVLYEGQNVFPTYDAEVKNLSNFLTQRITWMDREINK